jgi:putative ABC transport system substrate-binding protein
MNKTNFPIYLLLTSFWLIFSLLLAACGGAQAKESYTIGAVNYVPVLDTVFEGFKAGMAEQGYIEGENVTYIYNGVSEPNPEAIDREIKRLLDQDVDLIFTMGTLPTLRAKAAVEGTDIPVIFAPVINPVEEGLVDSTRQPGGNVTGVQNGNTIAKALEWLLKITPEATKVYVPYYPDDEVAVTSVVALSEAAPILGVELMLSEVNSLEEAIAEFETLPEGAVIFLIPSPSLEPLQKFAKAGAEHGFAVGSTNGSHLGSGAITTFAAEFPAIGKQAARMATRTLQGQDPSSLPVETAEYFLKIDLKTAETLGFNVPDEILQQATTIIR